MRYFRALAGGLGASGSLVIAAVILVGVLSTGLAFHGWPRLPGTGQNRIDLGAVPAERALERAAIPTATVAVGAAAD